MKALKITYWVTTVLISLGLLMGAFQELSHNPQMVQVFQFLGYPVVLLDILGTAKLLGAVALLFPKFPRLKEWAYAGVTFDLIGAAWSHLAKGDAAQIVMPFVMLVILAASYITFRLIQNKETSTN